MIYVYILCQYSKINVSKSFKYKLKFYYIYVINLINNKVKKLIV